MYQTPTFIDTIGRLPSDVGSYANLELDGAICLGIIRGRLQRVCAHVEATATTGNEVTEAVQDTLAKINDHIAALFKGPSEHTSGLGIDRDECITVYEILSGCSDIVKSPTPTKDCGFEHGRLSSAMRMVSLELNDFNLHYPEPRDRKAFEERVRNLQPLKHKEVYLRIWRKLQHLDPALGEALPSYTTNTFRQGANVINNTFYGPNYGGINTGYIDTLTVNWR